MSPAPGEALVRHPYDPRRLDALVAYAEAHRPSPYATPPVRRILAGLAPEAGIVELRRGGRPVLVAGVVDRCENAEDAAVLEILGLDPDAPLAACLSVATPIALDVARAAGRRAVTVSLPERLGGPGGPWRPTVGSEVMERDAAPWPSPRLPPGAAWANLTPANVAAHYRSVRAAFVDDPGMMLPDPDTFAAAALAADPPVRVLSRGAEQLGFARVALLEGRVGHVATIGRDPARRGAGLGPVVLAEALRVLAARGASRFRLGVTASNAAALALYRASGFAVAERWNAWIHPVAP